MESKVILIPSEFMRNAVKILKEHRIKYTVAGTLNKDTTIYQQFESSSNYEKPIKTDLVIEKIEKTTPKPISIIKKVTLKKRKPEKPKTDNFKPQSEHNKMLRFVEDLQCKSIGEAIVKVGSAAAFRRKFENECLNI